MPSDATSGPSCAGCDYQGFDVDLRPVVLAGLDDPRIVCPDCWRVVSELGLVDRDRDRERFGYGRRSFEDTLEVVDDDPGTWDFRVRATHVDRNAAEKMVTGNALDDPFGKVTIEEVIGPIPFDERGEEDDG